MTDLILNALQMSNLNITSQDIVDFLVIMGFLGLVASVVYAAYLSLAANGRDTWAALIISIAIVTAYALLSPTVASDSVQSLVLSWVLGVALVFLMVTGKVTIWIRRFILYLRQRIGVSQKDVKDEH